MSIQYIIEFKNYKNSANNYKKKYKNIKEICKEFSMTEPTIRKLIKEENGIYSKFIKISKVKL